jgi:hypothetical protein
MLTTQYITKHACVVNPGHPDFCHSLMSQTNLLISTTYVGVLYIRQNSINQVLVDFNLEYNLKTGLLPKLNTKPLLLLPETLHHHYFLFMQLLHPTHHGQ